MEHTKTPWRVQGEHIYNGQEGFYIESPAGHWSLMINCLFSKSRKGEAEANAKFIVEAVNSHDQLIADKKELVEALKRCNWSKCLLTTTTAGSNPATA